MMIEELGTKLSAHVTVPNISPFEPRSFNHPLWPWVLLSVLSEQQQGGQSQTLTALWVTQQTQMLLTSLWGPWRSVHAQKLWNALKWEVLAWDRPLHFRSICSLKINSRHLKNWNRGTRASFNPKSGGDYFWLFSAVLYHFPLHLILFIYFLSSGVCHHPALQDTLPQNSEGTSYIIRHMRVFIR